MEQTRWRQDFFDDVEPIKVRDPLAYVLGAQDEGMPMVFTYGDAVRLAGHSCPAVSGAYKLTAKALKALYPDELPVRGEIRVLVKGSAADLAYGPQAQVITLITGAAGKAGFKGLGGRFSRNGKLFFDPSDPRFNTFIFQREDTDAAVEVVYNPSVLPGDPRTSELMGLVLRGMATQRQHDEFVSLWQGKVRSILLEDESHPGLFTVRTLEGFDFPDASRLEEA
ncbi:MAG TPA: hypothetical protein ENJ37_04825 [Deltaproteobacteria bacterium]|nr:hypothetical protein [Deltaproteobacteria bacterium]